MQVSKLAEKLLSCTLFQLVFWITVFCCLSQWPLLWQSTRRSFLLGHFKSRSRWDSTQRADGRRMNRNRVSSIGWSLFFSEWVSFCPVSAPGGPSELTKLVFSVHPSLLKWRTLILFIDSLWCSQHLISFSGSSDHSDSLVPSSLSGWRCFNYPFTFRWVTRQKWVLSRLMS